MNQTEKSPTWKKILNTRNIFIFSGVLLIFFIALRAPTDPDMGWHLQDGKYLIEHNFKVAKTDIFSYTVPDFPLIMHEWTTDIVMEAVLEKTNLFTLSIIFATIITCTFLLVSLGTKAKKEYKVISAIMGVIASIPILGVRPQMLSLLGLAFVVYTVFRFRANHSSKIIYWLPVVFFVWVNTHGGFAVGLFFLGLFLAIELTKVTFSFLIVKISKKDYVLAVSRKILEKSIPFQSLIRVGIILALSFLATLLNPYGWRVYIEVITTAFDSYAKANINEWFPVTMANPMSYQFIIYLVLLAILLIFSYKRTDYTYLVICLVFLYLGLSSWRHMPLFLIVSTPLWVSITEELVGEELLGVVRRKWFLAFMVLAVFLIAMQKIGRDIPFSYSVERLSKDGAYPLGAVKYLKDNPIEGKMFNEYNWGGYLIWQYPEKKVFIDGRMPSWKYKDQKIFEEFNKVSVFEGDWQAVLDKYDVSFALVYNNPPNNVRFLNFGWKQVFSDELSCVYVRQND